MTTEVTKYINEVEIPIQHIFKDMLKYAPSKIFGLLGNLLIVPIYTNLLSPSQYGLYSISLAILSFLCIIFSDWIGMSGLRYFRQNQILDKIPQYLSTLILLLLFNLCIMFIACIGLKDYFYSYFFGITPKCFLFILLLIIPTSFRALLFQVLRAQIKPGAFTISTIINQVLTIGLAVFFIKMYNLGAMSILVAMAISISIIDILLIFQTKLYNNFSFQKPNFEILKTIFLYGLPIAITSLSVWIIEQSNKIITNYYHGLDTTAFVGVAYGLTFPILLTLLSVISIAAFPRIINLYEDNIDVRPIISKLTGYFLVVALPIATVMSLYAHDIISIFSNVQYQNAYVLLPYFAFSAVFLCFTDYTTYQYHLANKTYILTILKVISALLGLVLNIILIKKIGILGVGIALLISNVFYFLLTLIVKIPNLAWQVPYKRLFHIFLSFIPMISLWYIVKSLTILPLLQINILLVVYYLFFYTTRHWFKEIFK